MVSIPRFISLAANTAPATGPWAVGDYVLNKTPSVGQPIGWLCTVAGTPAPFSGQYVFNPAQAGQGPNYALTVTGGLAPYTWSFRQNASGASLSSSTGPAITYTAGTGTGIDIVQAVDSAGESTIWEGSAQIGGVHVNPP